MNYRLNRGFQMSQGVNDMSPLAKYINMTYPPARSVILYPKGMGDASYVDVYDGVTFQKVLSDTPNAAWQIAQQVYPSVTVWETSSAGYGMGANYIPYQVIQFAYNTPNLDPLIMVPTGTPASMVPTLMAALGQPQLNPGSQVNNPTNPGPVSVSASTPVGIQVGAPSSLPSLVVQPGSTGLAPQGNPILSPASNPVTTVSPLPANTLTPAIPATLLNNGTSDSGTTSTCSGFQLGSTCIDSTMLLIGGAAVVALLMFTGKK